MVDRKHHTGSRDRVLRSQTSIYLCMPKLENTSSEPSHTHHRSCGATPTSHKERRRFLYVVDRLGVVLTHKMCFRSVYAQPTGCQKAGARFTRSVLSADHITYIHTRLAAFDGCACYYHLDRASRSINRNIFTAHGQDYLQRPPRAPPTSSPQSPPNQPRCPAPPSLAHRRPRRALPTACPDPAAPRFHPPEPGLPDYPAAPSGSRNHGAPCRGPGSSPGPSGTGCGPPLPRFCCTTTTTTAASLGLYRMRLRAIGPGSGPSPRRRSSVAAGAGAAWLCP